MPRRDGTEPSGQEPGADRYQGPGRGRMGDPFVAGPGRKLLMPNLWSSSTSCRWTAM
jgi:hypothetical protein